MVVLLYFKKLTQINTGVPHWETHGSSTIVRGKKRQCIAGILLRGMAATFATIKSLQKIPNNSQKQVKYKRKHSLMLMKIKFAKGLFT